MKEAFTAIAAAVTVLLAIILVQRERNPFRESSPSMAIMSAAQPAIASEKPPSPNPQQALTLATVKVLDQWTLDDIKARPQALLDDLRQSFSGRELQSKLLTLGAFIKMYGTMNDLHNFMLALDNPAVTEKLSITLLTMTKGKDEAKSLIGFSQAWDDQPEGERIKHLLLQKAGSLLGMEGIAELESARQGNVSSKDLASSLAGAAQADPSSASAFLISEQGKSLSKDSIQRVLSSLVGRIPLEEVVGTAKAVSGKQMGDFHHHVDAIIFAAGLQSKPTEKAAFIEQTASLTEDQKAQAAQALGVNWGGQDLVGASGWIRSLPSGLVRDRAIYGLLNAIRNGNLNLPEKEQWLNAIEDDQLRGSAQKLFTNPN